MSRPLNVTYLVLSLFAAALVSLGAPTAASAQEEEELDRFLEECGGDDATEPTEEYGSSRLSDQCSPLAEIPNRPRPLIELGEPFLGTGTLGNGFKIPGGAVWQPSLLAFGTLRTALQGGTVPGSDERLVEAATRLDLFGNLYLTQTERILVGLRPFDQNGNFTRFNISTPSFEGDSEEPPEDFEDFLNGNVQTLFMEGDLAELIPALDPSDRRGLDIYFGVGRQPVGFQDGLLINEDAMDMVGLTRANMKIGGTVNTRVTFAYAWGEVTRPGFSGTITDEESQLFGLFSEIDVRSTTMEIDAAYVTGSEMTGDGFFAGIGDIRRFGRFSNTLRVLASVPIGDETDYNSQGVLIHNQFSWTPHHNHNFWWINSFLGVDRFRSAARGPSAGGPVGVTGVLFAAPGIGRVGAPLASGADDSFGASIGHQMFFDHTRQQLILEIGGRVRTKTPDEGSFWHNVAGAGGRYQAAMGRRFVLVIDAFGTFNNDADDDDDRIQAAGRLELVLKL